MVWPQTVLPLRVKIAPGANPALSPSNWPSWVDITTAVRIDDGVDISEGRANEGALVDAGQMSLTLDSRGAGAFGVGDFNPVNPNGQWYGLLKRNCPIRVGVDVVTDNFSRSSSSGWGNADLPTINSPQTWVNSGTQTDWTVSGTKGQLAILVGATRLALLSGANSSDVEGRFTASVPVVATGGSFNIGACVRQIDNSNYYALYVSFDVAGVVKLLIQRVKTSLVPIATVTLPTTYTAGQEWTCRFQAIGSTFAMKAWPTLSAEPAGWQAGVTDSVNLTGSNVGLLFQRASANTNAGTTITLNVDDYILEDVEWAGGITEFPVRWDITARESTVQLKAAGAFRRLSQGTTPVKSPLLRTLSVSTTVSPVLQLWALEDDAGSVAGMASTAGQPSMSATGVTFGASTDLLGSAQQARLDAAGSRLSVVVKSRLPATSFGFQYFGTVRFPSSPASTVDLVSMGCTGPVVRWQVSFSSTVITLTGFDVNNTITIGPTSTTFGGTTDITRWFAWSMQSATTGGTTTYTLQWRQATVGSTTFLINGTYASTVVSNPTGITYTAQAASAGVFVGPVRVGDVSLGANFNSAATGSSLAGWLGEAAGDRIARLCAESGVPGYTEGGTGEPMGVQRVDSLFSLLRECERTDYGVLFESGFGVAYRPRSARYARTPVLVLDRNSGHLSVPPQPTIDDQQLNNSWSISRDGGAQNVNALDQASINAEGVYDNSATINTVNDDPLASHAAWRVYLGIQPDLRWSQISINFARAGNTALLSQWRARTYGDRMTVANMPSQIAGNDPDVIIEGVSQHLSAYEWSVSTNTSPARPWDIATLDDTNLRIDAATSTLDIAVATTTFGSLQVTNNGDPYSTWAPTATFPTVVPFNITVMGEIMTVTNVGNIFATTKQTLTVTRSVNGVAKTHAAGEVVQLTRPAIVAL